MAPPSESSPMPGPVAEVQKWLRREWLRHQRVPDIAKILKWAKKKELDLTDHEAAIEALWQDAHWKKKADEFQTTMKNLDPKKHLGFGIPLTEFPDKDIRFPILVGDEDIDWKAATLTVREVCMLKTIEVLTNKPEWWIKVRDDKIAKKWKKEALQMDWSAYHEHGDFTPKMADACIKELRVKADIYEKTGLLPVMDYSACAIKSDSLISSDIKEALKAAVEPFENVPESRKDWHPGSKKRVLDLVHPSLWPLVYGRSRILENKRITVDNCLQHCGTGVVLPDPKVGDPEEVPLAKNFSSQFQWLPCDVDLTGEHPKIDSYINNVHPVKHAALYPVIEKIIEKSLPAWDIVYRWPESFDIQRVFTKFAGTTCTTEKICEKNGWGGCYPTNRPVKKSEDPREEDEVEEDWYEGSEREKLDAAWFKKTHPIELPDPKEKVTELIRLTPEDVRASGFFYGAERIQVIVKLANIHLTPDNPSYEGGSWHVEGQLNEHICGTALYYYDCDNITDCQLDFRTVADRENMVEELEYEQSDHTSIDRTFAIRSQDDTIQDIGSVLTREDRMLFFPNVYQHHVSPFELADKTRPGHRKILAMFLIDPFIPVISTAVVPPQQKTWWAESAIPTDRQGKLPPELMEMVVQSMDFPIDLKDAKKIRKKLMAERTRLQEVTSEGLAAAEWNFCEH